jgi:hypothetical protein
VPALAEVENKKNELESELIERIKDVRNLQDQLRESNRKCAK